MGTIIHRSFKIAGGFSLSEEARKRAEKYLLSLGYRKEELRPIEWPEDAVSAYRDDRHGKWLFTTKADILRKKKERMERNLRWKREEEVVKKQPLYVWVFWCPGFNNFFYRGWWIYLIGMGISECIGQRDETEIKRIFELFPLIDTKLFGFDWRDIEKWKKEFVKKYPRGTWCGKPQGKSPVWAETKRDRIIKILECAKWPSDIREYPK